MGNSCCSSQYASFGNLYEKTIKVKFDVQRPFIDKKDIGGHGELGFGPAKIVGRGHKIAKHSWNKVSVQYTSIKPGEYIRRLVSLQGQVFLTVVTDDKVIDVNTWHVASHTSWLITQHGELKRADDKNPLQVHKDDAVTDIRLEERKVERRGVARQRVGNDSEQHPMATKSGYLDIKTKTDKKDCHICGMAVTKNGILLLIDRNNKNIKSFSSDNKVLSVLPLSGEPNCITVIKKTEAVVAGLRKETLYVIDVSQPTLLSLKKTNKLKYGILAMTNDFEDLIVICNTDPASIKMLDYKREREIWSISTNTRGRALFTKSYAVTISKLSRSLPIIIVVTLEGTAIILESINGRIIRKQRVEEKWYRGITKSSDERFYFLNCLGRKEIYVMTDECYKGWSLLSGDELIGIPKAVACHLNILYVSYEDENMIEYFKITD